MSQVERLKEEKSAKRKSKQGKGKVAWRGFLSCELTKAQGEEIATYVESGDLSADMVFEVVNHSYKFGVNYYAVDDCFVATFMDTDPESSFAGFMLSGWGATPQKACVSLLYKHLYAWRGGWKHKTERGKSAEYG